MAENERKQVGYTRWETRFPLRLTHVYVNGDSFDRNGHLYEDSSVGLCYEENGKEYVNNADSEGRYDFVPEGFNRDGRNVEGVIREMSFSNERKTYGEGTPLKHSMAFKDFLSAGKPTSLEAKTETTFFTK